MIKLEPATQPFQHSSRRIMYLDFNPTAIYNPPDVITHYDNLLLKVESELYENYFNPYAVYSQMQEQTRKLMKFTIY